MEIREAGVGQVMWEPRSLQHRKLRAGGGGQGKKGYLGNPYFAGSRIHHSRASSRAPITINSVPGAKNATLGKQVQPTIWTGQDRPGQAASMSQGGDRWW